jgi:hypothetical protein
VKVLVAFFILVAFTGCAAKLVSTSPRSVVISAGDARVQEAQNMADAECAKHGRYARLRELGAGGLSAVCC